MPQHVAGYAAPELLDEHRPFGPRPHDGHISLEHIDELRQFVERGAAHERAEPGGSLLARLRPYGAGSGFGVHGHGAKLQHVERASVQPHPVLFVKHRAGRGQLYADGEQEQERGQEDQRRRRESHVHDAFRDASELQRRFVDKMDDRQALHAGDPAVHNVEMKQVRDEADVRQSGGQFVHDRLDAMQDRERKRDIDVMYGPIFPLETIHDRHGLRNAAQYVFLAFFVVVKVARNLEPDPGILSQRFPQFASGVTRPQDEYAPQVHPSLLRAPERHIHSEAGKHHQRRGGAAEKHHVQARERQLAVEG